MSFGGLIGQTYPEFPIGGICLWSGSQDSIPNNWVLCDGNNGTPDLRNRFIVGSGDKYQVGAIGGEETHILSVDEMPRHNHIYGPSTSNNFNRPYNSIGLSNITGNLDGRNSYPPSHLAIQTSETGNNQPHNNLPPYYALCYIMKVA